MFWFGLAFEVSYSSVERALACSSGRRPVFFPPLTHFTACCHFAAPDWQARGRGWVPAAAMMVESLQPLLRSSFVINIRFCVGPNHGLGQDEALSST